MKLSDHLRELRLAISDSDVNRGAVRNIEEIFGTPRGFAAAAGLRGAQRELVVAAGLVEESGFGFGNRLLLFVDRSYIKIGTIICMFCGGPIIDVFNLILSSVVTPDSTMAVRVISNVLGCVILALGMSIVIKSDAGTGPNDLVGVVISDKLKKKFSIIRMIVDACFLICGR